MSSDFVCIKLSIACIVDPLPPEDLPIGGQSDKKAKAMMHVDEGILGNDAW
jgi:hypothetical protein